MAGNKRSDETSQEASSASAGTEPEKPSERHPLGQPPGEVVPPERRRRSAAARTSAQSGRAPRVAEVWKQLKRLQQRVEASGVLALDPQRVQSLADRIEECEARIRQQQERVELQGRDQTSQEQRLAELLRRLQTAERTLESRETAEGERPLTAPEGRHPWLLKEEFVDFTFRLESRLASSEDALEGAAGRLERQQAAVEQVSGVLSSIAERLENSRLDEIPKTVDRLDEIALKITQLGTLTESLGEWSSAFGREVRERMDAQSASQLRLEEDAEAQRSRVHNLEDALHSASAGVEKLAQELQGIATLARQLDDGSAQLRKSCEALRAALSEQDLESKELAKRFESLNDKLEIETPRRSLGLLLKELRDRADARDEKVPSGVEPSDGWTDEMRPLVPEAMRLVSHDLSASVSADILRLPEVESAAREAFRAVRARVDTLSKRFFISLWLSVLIAGGCLAWALQVVSAT